MARVCLVICAVLVPYMSNQRGEFIIIGRTRLYVLCICVCVCVPYGFIMRRKYFAGHVLSLTMNVLSREL